MEQIRNQQERNFHVHQLAHWSLRFANFAIDMIVIIGLQVLYLFLFKDYIKSDPISGNINLVFVFIAFFYYVLFEYNTGKTIGKYITKTTVVTDGGLKPSLKTIIIRTLCRFIPFETFSCIATAAHGWHNSLSNTIVLPDSEV